MHSAGLRRFGRTTLLVIFMMILPVLPAASQTIFLGAKSGVPMMDAFARHNTASVLNTYTFDTKRYTVGPSFELSLPLKLSFEVDALYKHLDYESSPFGFPAFHLVTTANSWEFPFLVRKRFLVSPIQPYGDMGVSLRRVDGTTNFTAGLVQGHQPPAELVQTWATGFAVGGGVDFAIGRLHLMPEIRYTRWGTENFSSRDGFFDSNLNSTDFLIGVAFRK